LLPLGEWVRNPALRSWPVLLFISLVAVPPVALHSSDSNLFASVFTIGLPEELAKAIPVLAIALVCRRRLAPTRPRALEAGAFPRRPPQTASQLSPGTGAPFGSRGCSSVQDGGAAFGSRGFPAR
jgi:hypothetical protein